MALQTKTFTVGSTTTAELSYYALELILTEESTDVVSNSSKISYVLQLRSGNNRFSQYRTGAEIKLNGVVVATHPFDYSHQLSLGYNETLEILAGSVDIPHNADGSMSIDVAFSITQEKASYTPGSVSVTGKTMTLTVIHRQHEINAAAANIEETAMIAINTNGDSLQHSIAYRFGNLTGYVDASGNPVSGEVKFSAASVGFKVPSSFYAQIPNDPSGVCYLTCKTYSGNTQVGNDTPAQFTATAARSRCAPYVAGTVVDSNSVTKALTGNSNKLVRYYSTARCTMTAEAKHSASIEERKIVGKAVSSHILEIPAVETNTFTFWAKDSRGYETAGTPVTAELIPYIKLTNQATGVRTDPTSGNAQIRFSGDYYNGSFGAVGNFLKIRYRGSGESSWNTVTPTFSGNKYSAAVSLSGLEYTQSYGYEVEVEDRLEIVRKTVTVGQGIPTFNWGKDYFNVNTLFNGLSIRTSWISGVQSFRLRSKFDQWGDASSRQSMFLFGSDNWTPIYGLLTVRSNGDTQWSGQGALTLKTSKDDSSLPPGVVEVTMPVDIYDQFTVIAYGLVSFV